MTIRWYRHGVDSGCKTICWPEGDEGRLVFCGGELGRGREIVRLLERVKGGRRIIRRLEGVETILLFCGGELGRG